MINREKNTCQLYTEVKQDLLGSSYLTATRRSRAHRSKREGNGEGRRKGCGSLQLSHNCTMPRTVEHGQQAGLKTELGIDCIEKIRKGRSSREKNEIVVHSREEEKKMEKEKDLTNSFGDKF